jgi:hypothetical protein
MPVPKVPGGDHQLGANSSLFFYQNTFNALNVNPVWIIRIGGEPSG